MKRIIVWITVLTLVLAGVFAMNACNKTDDNGVTYELNLKNFSGIVAYGEEVDLSSITIIKTEEGVATEVPVDPSMVTTPVDTSKVGAKLLKLNYSGQTFHVPVVVKYKVQYLADNLELKTMYVLSAAELEAVDAPKKDGYVFSGWSSEIPDIITDNITLSAVYTPFIPELSEMEATYGDKLTSVQLPSTVVGAWQFDAPEGTVGNAGEQTFDVRFVMYETGEVLQRASLTVHVAKKEVVFSDVVTSFVYDGEEHKPTFTTNVPVQVDFYASGNANYIDAGTYEYYFEVNDPNYSGELVGTFVITPAKVTVKIGDYTILSNEVLPEIEYTVEGFDQEKLYLLDLVITNPEDFAGIVGTHTLTATTLNPNVELVVENGTLVINSTTLDVTAPTLLDYTVCYGDEVGVIGFHSHPNGKWIWKSPSDPVGDKGYQKHVAVFIPNDNRYDPVECEVTIIVEAKKLVIEIVGSTTFVYDGVSEYALSYNIKDADGNLYNHLSVLGNEPCKNAGSYRKTLTLENPNYDATTVVNLIVNKAIPATDFTQVFTANWATAPRLSDFQLPAGYSWVKPNTALPGAGTHYYEATYTPVDGNNYQEVTGKFRIDVEKATASISGVENSYSSVYNGKAFAIQATRSHNESELTFSFEKNGVSVQDLINAGIYEVTITLPETANYLQAQVTTTVTIEKANTSLDGVNLFQTAVYGDAASSIQLPESIYGEWTLKGNPQTVGNAGTNVFVAVFTPASENYNACEVEITVTVARKTVHAPTISLQNATQVYTGETLYSGLADKEGYTVTDNGGVTVGSYTATLSLISDNYIWNNGESGDKYLTYTIVAATNQWVDQPTINSWIYGEAGDLGTANAVAGQLVIEYKPSGAEDSAYSSTLPSNAGAYVARFTVTDPNYNALVETRAFTISKKSIDAPVISDDKLSQVYTGSILSSGLSSTNEYTVTGDGRVNAGTYKIQVALNDKVNYQWTGSDSSDIQYTYTIEKAQVVLSNFGINGWTYGDSANAPTASTNFGTITYVYATAIDGEYGKTAPVDAGTYFVKAVVQGDENLIGAETVPASFTIAKASTTIQGANDTYSKVYDAKDFELKGVTVSNGATPTVVITKDGNVAEKILNAGEYVVTISYAGDNNYLAAEKIVNVTVHRATNNEIVNTNQSAIYGNLASVIVLPEGIEGYWSLENVDADTKVGNAGVNTFKAVFTSTTGNYNGREEEITVTVAKATVKVPLVENHEYDEQYHNSGLEETDEYFVAEDIGGIDHGNYQVVLTLKDPANYKWATTEEATLTIQYVISVAVNKWVDAPTIADSWEYESAGDTGSASALHGTVTIEYKLESEDDSKYSTTLPTLPGKYVARFTTTDDNYTLLEKTLHFEITKRAIDVPKQSATEFVYNGSIITSGIVSNDFYTVVDSGSIDVQNGLVATVTLNSEYYVWADGVETLARIFTYSVVKADIVITDPVIDGWTYGENANVPTSENDFEQVVSYVYATDINGNYTENVPVNAGTYYVKAIAKGNDNLNYSESKPVSFTIAKAQASIEGAEERYTAIYSNSAYIIQGVKASNGEKLEYVYTKNGETVSQIWNAGDYTVTITLPETVNYVGDEVTVTVTIEKIVNTDSIPTYTATYGDKLSALNVPTSTTGTWAWSGITEETTVGNAGVQTHTLVFTPADTENYETRTVEVSVTVYKKVVTTPTVPNSTNVYNGTTQYSGIPESAIYTVSNDGHVDVGTYTVTLTLVDAANYAWNDKDNETVTVEVTYSITKGTNAITDISYTERWTYNDVIADFSANAKYGDLLIEYTSDDITYTTARPTDVGSYKVRFTTKDTNCDPVVEVRTFTIEKATVPTPSVVESETPYTGTTITSGIVSNDLYTVVDNGGVNVGTYTAVLKLKDANNYKWSSTGNGDDIELTYTIKKVTTKIEIITAGWAYGEYKAPTVEVVEPAALRDQIIFWYSTDNGVTWSETPPVEIGTYLIRAEILESTNYTAASIGATTFFITKGEPTLSDPWFKGGKYYKNQFTANANGMTATHMGISVAGTFSFSDPVFVDGANASYITVTFTPDDTNKYVSVEETYYFTFVSVAYINNTTAYGSIEDALAVAGTGDVVWVRPHDADLGPIYIMSDVTIPSGATLLLPYGVTNDKLGRNQWSGNQPFFELHGGGCSYDKHKDGGEYRKHTDNEGHYPSELDPNKCVLKVILAAGKTITNNGILEIAGELSGGGAGAQYAGFTAGKHATLVLDANAKLISNNGSKIYAAGFIRETSKDNGSEVIINSGATLFQPHTIKDYRDGSYMVAAKNGMGDPYWSSAYNRFVMMNVSPTLKIYYGGVMSVWASLFTGSTQGNNTTTQNFIGSDTAGKDAVIVLTKSYSYLVAKYDPETEICDLNIYGGAKTQIMTLKVNMIITVTVTTENSFFPLSYHYNITLAKSDLKDENGNLLQGADEVAIFDMGQRFKLMNGACLTIEEGARANFGTLIVYENFVDDCAYHSADYRYPNKPAATLTVNGELVCGTFGGKIYSNNEGARVTINTATSCTAYEITNINASNFSSSVTAWNKIPETAKLVNGDNATIVSPAVTPIYKYVGGEWIAQQIHFNSDGGSTPNSLNITSNMTTYPALPLPTKEGSVFQGWYYNGVLVKEGDALHVAGPHTLTAQWSLGIPVQLDPNGGTVEQSEVYFKPADGTYPFLYTPTLTGYAFAGWYYGETLVKEGDPVQSTEAHTLTAKWELAEFTITVETTNATVKINGTAVANKGTIKVKYTSTVEVEVTFTQSNNKTLTVDGKGVSLTDGKYSFTMPAEDIKVAASSSSGGCFTPDTLITLADGTQKRVDALEGNEMLLVWDFYNGEYTIAPIGAIVSHGYENVNKLTLNFANGSTINTIYGHGFFDVSENKFVIIDEANVDHYVGHEFVAYDSNGNSVITVLENYSVETTYTEVVTIVSAVHMNCVLEGMLTLSPTDFDNSPAYLMPFEIGEGMKYDEEKMKADIEKYGQYTYEDFAEYCTYEQFIGFNFADWKVAVGKGFITFEEIIYLINSYVN